MQTKQKREKIVNPKQRISCPRCKSKRLELRLDASRYCMRCGMRWKANGELVPSFDRRTLKVEHEESEDKDLPYKDTLPPKEKCTKGVKKVDKRCKKDHTILQPRKEI